MPGLMIFSATLRRTGCCCSATKTRPMPPSPICSMQLVGTDDRAGALGDRLVILSRVRARRNILEKAARGVVGVQERFDFTAQLGV